MTIKDSTSQMSEQKIDRILYGTTDPTVILDGHPVPAMTTMLYQVCGNDEKKFEEATRLIGLFIREAMKNQHEQA